MDIQYTIINGAAALSTEERKHTENDPKCNALGWCCIPLVAESYGAWGKEAIYFV